MIPFHPLADIFPLIEGAEFDDLVHDVREHGIREQIILLDGKILDGRNRYRAGVIARMLPESLDELTVSQLKLFKHYAVPGETPSHDELLAFVLSKNLHRRHMNESQRAMVAAKLANMPSHRPDDKSANLQTSQDDAARRLNVSTRSVASAKQVQDHAEPELRAAVEQGHIAVSVAAVAARLPADDQRTIAEKLQSGEVNAARNHVKKAARTEKERDLGAKQTALPDERFGVIVADPEWRFEPFSRDTGMDRAADNHYPTSATEIIAARPVQEIAAPDCVLFLWATVPMLPDALTVMAAWGFEYKSHFVWVKDRLGTGYWNRNQHELLLIGTRGHPPAPAPGTRESSAIQAPVGEHSAKPEIVLEYIEGWYPSLPKIELNRRGPARPGWKAWGNEAPEQAA